MKPPGGFGAVMADVPWTFKVRSDKGVGRGAVKHYETMTLEDIKALDVADVCAPDAWLFFWTTGTHMQDAFEVITAWGFTYSAMGFVWIKLTPSAPEHIYSEQSFHVGMGYTTRKNAEFCLLGRRGSPKRLSNKVRELVIAPRREHSRKPDEVPARIEQFCAGPYLDMFSRESRPGWVSWGLETGKFDEGNAS